MHPRDATITANSLNATHLPSLRSRGSLFYATRRGRIVSVGQPRVHGLRLVAREDRQILGISSWSFGERFVR